MSSTCSGPRCREGFYPIDPKPAYRTNLCQQNLQPLTFHLAPKKTITGAPGPRCNAIMCVKPPLPENAGWIGDCAAWGGLVPYNEACELRCFWRENGQYFSGSTGSGW